MGWLVEAVQYICGPSRCSDMFGPIHASTLHCIWRIGRINQSVEFGNFGPSGKVHNIIWNSHLTVIVCNVVAQLKFLIINSIAVVA